MNNITKCNEFYNNSQQILQSVCHQMNSHQGQNMVLCQGPVFSVVTNRVVNIRPSICEGRRSTPRGAALVLVSALAFYCFYLFGLLRGKLGQLKNTVCSCGNRVQMCKILNCISEKPFTVCNIFEAEGEPCKEKANRSQQEQKADQSLRIFALYSETSKAVQCNFHVRPPPVSDHRSKTPKFFQSNPYSWNSS